MSDYISSISILPLEILSAIFTKLPIKSLCKCIPVCKTWHAIILNPDFTKLHHTATPPSLLLHTQTYHFNGTILNTLYFIQHRHCDNLPTTFPNLPVFDVVGSCNGIICVSNPTKYDPFCLCNPLTGQYFFLPRNDDIDCECEIVSGFGFDERINKFKVVRMKYIVHTHLVTKLSSYRLVGEVITIASASASAEWRSIGDVRYPLRPRRAQTFLNGALHWLMNANVSGMDDSQILVSFQIDDEVFVPLSLSAEFDSIHQFKSELGVLEEKLCLFDYFLDAHMDIWMMMNYGVQDSWCKKFKLNVELASYLLKPIAIVDNGDILLIYDGQALVAYNPFTQSFTDIVLHGLPPKYGSHSKFTAIIHVGTLISIQNAVQDIKRFGLSERSENMTLSSSCVSC